MSGQGVESVLQSVAAQHADAARRVLARQIMEHALRWIVGAWPEA
jgi:hypothetical protein